MSNPLTNNNNNNNTNTNSTSNNNSTSNSIPMSSLSQLSLNPPIRARRESRDSTASDNNNTAFLANQPVTLTLDTILKLLAKNTAEVSEKFNSILDARFGPHNNNNTISEPQSPNRRPSIANNNPIISNINHARPNKTFDAETQAMLIHKFGAQTVQQLTSVLSENDDDKVSILRPAEFIAALFPLTPSEILSSKPAKKFQDFSIMMRVYQIQLQRLVALAEKDNSQLKYIPIWYEFTIEMMKLYVSYGFKAVTDYHWHLFDAVQLGKFSNNVLVY
jgi:hypothetical protein